MSEPDALRVLHALRELRGDSSPVPVSTLAAYLKCDERLVAARLRALRRSGMAIAVTVNGERAWTTVTR